MANNHYIRSIKIKAAVLSAALFIVTLQTSAIQAKQQNVETKPSSRILITLENEHGGPALDLGDQEEFDCNDKIFTVVELQNYPKEKFQLSVKWINPEGDVQEHTQYPFNVHNDATRVWAWLSLSRATGAGMLQFINPAAGMEEFVGEWNVEVSLNDKRIGNDRFLVLC
jgi:hypothetical protein